MPITVIPERLKKYKDREGYKPLINRQDYVFRWSLIHCRDLAAKPDRLVKFVLAGYFATIQAAVFVE
jgi:hypothetical protein